jgi:hypothetical protein
MGQARRRAIRNIGGGHTRTREAALNAARGVREEIIAPLEAVRDTLFRISVFRFDPAGDAVFAAEIARFFSQVTNDIAPAVKLVAEAAREIDRKFSRLTERA